MTEPPFPGHFGAREHLLYESRWIEDERNGPCRDINFDPTVLPSGMKTSDDPFPAARSSAYAKSFDRRTAEAKDYPRTVPGAKP